MNRQPAKAGFFLPKKNRVMNKKSHSAPGLNSDQAYQKPYLPPGGQCSLKYLV
jgi:hypothetical protein